MGKHDNRRSMKMRRRIGQKKKKARLKKQRAARAAKAAPSGKSGGAKKTRTATGAGTSAKE